MTSDDDFPGYSYVPGLWPHPHSDQTGHRYKPLLPASDLDALSTEPTFLLAVRLFDAGYYWEAHEQWEILWHRAGRSGPVADLMKAMIQLAVVGIKTREGRPDGARTHARRAAELFVSAVRGVVDIPSLRNWSLRFSIDPPPTPSEPRRPVEIVFDFRIANDDVGITRSATTL